RFCAAIMLVSEGYPEAYEKGKIIYNSENIDDSIVFHAGSKIGEENTVVTNGGRVMAISSFGSDMDEALKKSYKNAAIIDFDGKYYRKDLGQDLKKYSDQLESN
ncbi:MAG: phosphoribosylamine--glycine ligase, partial [Bacteroidales bacterium]|nr:phosphoribosylamine--glycine ligase [Bacteroidales bacterium]